MASKLSLWNSTDGDSESQHLLGGIQRGGGNRKPPTPGSSCGDGLSSGSSSGRRYTPERLRAVAQNMAVYLREVVANEQRRSEIWGGVPEYHRHHEDEANIASLLTYHWVGKYIFVAANEQLTNDTLSPPTQPNRSWESGFALAAEVQDQMSERHRWDPLVGCLVRLRPDVLRSRDANVSETDWPTGVLKWVGREWRAKSAPLLVGVEWEVAPEWNGVQMHSGVVDGETRFQVEQDSTATCERAEDVEILLPEIDEMATLLSYLTDDTSAAVLQSGDGLLPRSASKRNGGDSGTTTTTTTTTAAAVVAASSTIAQLAAAPPRKPSALRAFIRVHKWILLAQVPFKLVADYTNLSFPLILEFLVDFLDSPSPQWNVGMGLLAVIFFFNIISTLTSQKFYHMSIRSGLVVRGSFLGYIYEKCFSISQKALAHPEMSTGRIVNMVSTDVERANDFCWYAMYLWASPQQLLIAVGLLYRLVGWCAIAGLGAMLLTMPIQGWIAKQQQKLRMALSKVTDQRVKVTSELFGGIRIIKYMAWEPDFLERIQDFRRQELTLLKRIQRFRVLTSLLNVAAPTIVIATVLVLYHVTGHRLTARVVFPTIALLNLMRMPFMTIPFIFTALIQLLVAMTRVSRFMECENENIGQVQDIRTAAEKFLPTLCDAACALESVSLAAYTPSKLPQLLGGLSQPEASHIAAMVGRIRSRCACLSCRGAASPTSGTPSTKPVATEEHFELTQKVLLRDITVRIPKQKLTVVIGPTGCGKSTLLEAFLGQFDVIGGQIFAPRDGIAYVPQQPWIMNATLKSNILFFSPLDEARFDRALEACQLKSDLLTFPNGVDTEIGEKGVNLSGGQRARVSLARALYAEREVYLLDDPLSALDPHVSERVVDECICRALGGTTRVLCTHQTQVLAKADFIVALGSDSNIAFQGTYDAFLAAQPELSAQRQLTSPMLTATMSSSPLAKPHPSGVGFHASCDGSHDGAVSAGDVVAATAPAAGETEQRANALEGTASQESHQPPPVAEAACSGGESDDGDEDPLLDPDEAEIEEGLDQKASSGSAGTSTAAALASTAAAPTAASGGAGAISGKLMTDEEKAVGSVPWKTYQRYFDACGGTPVVILVLLIFTVTEVFSVSSSVWLSIWSVQSYGLSQATYLYVFLGCVALSTLSTPWRFYVAYNAMRQASLNMHQQVLHSVASAPMSFFDTTPLGRILNRFARDMDMCDNDLQMSYIMALSTIFSALSTSCVMLASQPYTLIAIVPCTVVYYRLMLFYNRANREIRRVSSIAKSPMFALLTEALTGYRSIRAYGKCHIMMTQAIRRLDIIFGASYLQNAANRWLGVRIEFLANCIITTIAGLAIFGKLLSFGSTNVGLLSLGFTMALSITQVLNWIIRQVAAVEADMNSVERLAFYTDNIEHEDIPELTDAINRRLRDLAPTTRTRATQFPEPASAGLDDGTRISTSVSAVAALPGEVVIAFKDVAMRYRPGLPLVLSHLSFEIHQGEKVGVVGRTGSGKSSLLLTFLRIVDICDGRIEVLQRPIDSYGIHELRRWYSMIPQDPLLFDGTVRSNLDPFQDCTDDDVKKALQYVGMQERIAQEPLGIRSPVLEHGSNFSVGQRQLLCLARALLRKGARFILMDEATANIDHALDRRIQATVKTAFANHTVITIAHRLHTILEYQRILVMDKGRVVENGAPWELAKDPTSVLRSMMSALGPETEAKLLRLVEKSRRAHESRRK